MSTAMKLQPFPPQPLATQCRTQALVAASAIRGDDRVVVIGQGSFDHLLGLARFGCKSAVALLSSAQCLSEANAADVVWFTGIETISSDLATVIDHLVMPRTVAIELAQGNAKAGLPSILGQLRAKELVDQAVSKAGGRVLVVASRPAWLRRVL